MLAFAGERRHDEAMRLAELARSESSEVHVDEAQWLSWLERRPVTAEVAGSSPAWVVQFHLRLNGVLGKRSFLGKNRESRPIVIRLCRNGVPANASIRGEEYKESHPIFSSSFARRGSTCSKESSHFVGPSLQHTPQWRNWQTRRT